jgi:sugar phosphate isomerase/epimerase
LQEAGRGRPISGSGKVDWNRVFEIAETVGGVEWYVVEDEHEPGKLERIEQCLAALRAMGK